MGADISLLEFAKSSLHFYVCLDGVGKFVTKLEEKLGCVELILSKGLAHPHVSNKFLLTWKGNFQHTWAAQTSIFQEQKEESRNRLSRVRRFLIVELPGGETKMLKSRLYVFRVSNS